MNVGFIGLGTMGRHMASNLIKGGHKVDDFLIAKGAGSKAKRKGKTG